MAKETTEVWRIFSREDGTSAMEPIQIPMADAEHGTLSKLLEGPGAMFRWFPGHYPADWHRAPRRQLVATLYGEAEIETGDGQKLTIKPGVITLVEDLTGIGHITRSLGVERLLIFVPLDEDTVVA